MASHLSAVEILKLGDSGRDKPWLNKYWPQIMGVSFGLFGGCFANYQTRRPYLAGIQRHIIAAGLFTLAFSFIAKKREDYLAEKDAVYRHYIELHPEDFVEPPRQKIGDLFEPWIPVR